MEEFSQLGGNLWASAGLNSSSSSSSSSASASTLPGAKPNAAAIESIVFDRRYCMAPPSNSPLLPPTSSFHHQSPSPVALLLKPEGASASQINIFPPQGRQDHADAIKAKIVTHPQYSSLVSAYIECQKVGAPPDIRAKLSVVAQEFEMRERTSLICRDAVAAPDSELDQFMEAYHDMLIKYREELSRPLQEAMEFLRRMDSQLTSIADGTAAAAVSLPTNSNDDKHGVYSSFEEEQLEGSGGEMDADMTEVDPCTEDQELKHHLLKKYGGYLGSLKQELSKKKKKGKLPKDARQQLLNWWELHYKWPYPSETQKAALAESTGLDMKQINNWFINQRKRHWKPSEDMQFVVMDGYHHAPNPPPLFMDAHFITDPSAAASAALYRLAP